MAKFCWAFSLSQADDIHPRSTGMSHYYQQKGFVIASCSSPKQPSNCFFIIIHIKAWHCTKGHVPLQVLTKLKSGIAGRERHEADNQGHPKGQWRIFSLQSSTWPELSAAGWEGMSPTPKNLLSTPLVSWRRKVPQRLTRSVKFWTKEW